MFIIIVSYLTSFQNVLWNIFSIVVMELKNVYGAQYIVTNLRIFCMQCQGNIIDILTWLKDTQTTFIVHCIDSVKFLGSKYYYYHSIIKLTILCLFSYLTDCSLNNATTRFLSYTSYSLQKTYLALISFTKAMVKTRKPNFHVI